MAQYMLLLHQVPNYNMDLPREKMLEMTRRYMAWADGLRQKGKLAGGEKLAAGGVRHIKVRTASPWRATGLPEAKDVIGGYFVIGQGPAEARRSPGLPHLCDLRHLGQIRPIETCRRPGGRELSAPVRNSSVAGPRFASRLVAALARRASDASRCRDAVQHALLQAHLLAVQGVPAGEAWLAVVAKNRALDLLRHEQRGLLLAEELIPLAPSDREGEGRFDRELNDDELALLFAVCHPVLSPELRVTFALKSVCGLTVQQIASGLLSEPTAIAQRLVRARRQLANAGVAIEAPLPDPCPARRSVRTTLYLMFNEAIRPRRERWSTRICIEAAAGSALAQHRYPPVRRAMPAAAGPTGARLPTRWSHGVAQPLEITALRWMAG
jgi:DNA-directed RNA polymerase specialized sigma24 family protein